MGVYDVESGKYTKLKKAYVVENGKYVKLKKAYVVEGGKYVKLWSSGEAKYHGELDGLTYGRCWHSSISLNGWAIFAMGKNADGFVTSADVYGTSLTHSVFHIGYNAVKTAAATVGNYGLFAGGNYSTTDDLTCESNSVRCVTDSLTVKYLGIGLPQKANYASGTSVGNYAIFGGGRYVTNAAATSTTYFLNQASAFNTSLTRTDKQLSEPRYWIAGVSLENYAIFAGGNSSSNGKVVDAFDSSLTRTTPTVLSSSRRYPKGVKVGKYALITGGHGNDTGSNVADVEVYDTSLTRTTITSLPNAVANHAVATLQDKFAIIVGGTVGSYKTSDVYSMYDASLTRTTGTMDSTMHYGEGASTNDAAIFAGDIYYYTRVHAFTMSD